MKCVTVHVTQEPTVGKFRVVRFTNTVKLSIGQIVDADMVGQWCAAARINVHVDGMTRADDESEETNLLCDAGRVNALSEKMEGA